MCSFGTWTVVSERVTHTNRTSTRASNAPLHSHPLVHISRPAEATPLFASGTLPQIDRPCLSRVTLVPCHRLSIRLQVSSSLPVQRTAACGCGTLQMEPSLPSCADT